METLSNVASAASKAIFGEQNNPQATTQGNETQGQEPISGEQGKGTVTEPFDQGNSENPTSTTSSGVTGTSTADKTSSGLTGTSTTDTTSNTTNTTNPTDMSTSNVPNNPTNVAAGGEPNPLAETDKTGVTSGRQGDSAIGSDVIPSERQANPGAAPASGSGPEFKQQGADKPGDAPSGAEAGAVKEKKDEAEDALKKRDPNDHSGEPMKMHGTVPGTQEERRESKAGMPGGQEHGREPKGTGEEWVKTTGLAADGGDFDATKPGAGREADRLLEEKGIHKTEPGQPAAEPAEGATTSKADKPSMGQKIKDKLHIGHKDK